MARSELVDRDHGWREMLRAVQALAGGAYVKVGILGGDDRGGLHRIDPATGKASPLTVAESAVVNEFGTEDGRVPSRSFVRSTFDRMREELARDAAKLIVRIIFDRKITVEQALGVLGMKLATGIRSTIVDGAGVPPPNAPSTARAKARGTGKAREKAIAMARPLVDTGAMLNAISWGVVLGTVEKTHQFLTGRKKG